MTLSTIELVSTIALFCGATTLLVFQLSLGRRKSNLPPGPKPLPIIGNLLDVPKNKPWITYAEWSQAYGSDILHMKVLGKDIIIVNSSEAAKALFERKSGLYSGRPRMTMISELIGLSWHFAFMPHNDSWRDHRKMFNSEFNPAAATQFHEQEKKWNRRFLQNLLETPDQLLVHIQHMASGTVLETTYGLEVQPSGKPDPFIHAATQAISAMGSAGLYGSYIVDYIPFLKYVSPPFTKFRRQATVWKKSVDIAASVPFSITKENIENGKAAPSVTKRLLQINGVDDTVVRQAGAAMFSSGSAGTVSALSSFFLAMLLNPDVQAKAQQELDRVVQNRLPDFSDEPSLPYISAIIREVLRLYPVVPLSFPHLLNADDTYESYHLPAGSVVIPNAWAMLRETSLYGPNADSFDPSRFLTASGELNQAVKFPDAAFGFARRACPGRHLALSSMFLTVATTLKLFTISPVVDGNETTYDCTTGLLSYPMPFKCNILPRSNAAISILHSTPPQ